MKTHPWHARKIGFRGDPTIGLYVYVNDHYCFVGPEVPDEAIPTISEVFAVPVHRLTIAGTGLVGVFLAGNNKTLLIPSIATDRERAILNKLGIHYTEIDTDFTALGNNILCSDKGCLVSEEYSDKERAAIGKALGVPVKLCKLGEITVIGSCAARNTRGCVLHRAAKDFEQELIADTLGVPVTLGTINLGNPFMRAGLVTNSNGMLAGDTSGGPELVNAEDALRGDHGR